MPAEISIHKTKTYNMRKKNPVIFILLLLHLQAAGQLSRPAGVHVLKGSAFQNISLEVSLKPFKQNNEQYIRKVAEEIFTQWFSLLRHTDTVSIKLWTSDGSEILD